MGSVSRSRSQNSGSAQVCAPLGHSLIIVAAFGHNLLLIAALTLRSRAATFKPAQTDRRLPLLTLPFTMVRLNF